MSNNLSPGEQKLLAILDKQREPIATTELVPLFYAGEDEPEHAQKVISGLARSLEYKTRREPVKVKRSRRRGPHPVEVWLERRKGK